MRPSLSIPTSGAPLQVLSNVTLTLRQSVDQPRCATPSYTSTLRYLLLPWTCQVAYEWVRSLALIAPTSPSDFQCGVDDVRYGSRRYSRIQFPICQKAFVPLDIYKGKQIVGSSTQSLKVFSHRQYWCGIQGQTFFWLSPSTRGSYIYIAQRT